MIKKSHGSGLIVGAHTAAQIAQREDLLNKARKALDGRTLHTSDLATELGVKHRRAYALVARLVEQGEACAIVPKNNNLGNQWRLVDEHHRPAPRLPSGFAQRTKIVDAVQVGMQRHWMDVALFGPAGGAGAAA